ncbi:MAG: ATP-binding cassette domain-containing protein [Mycobacterium sp.]|uniref:ATP-binding cassette domain-containing protein n=1 Tax=Mycobacterium sp. TaxID=1785 RepID=UPI003C3BF508
MAQASVMGALCAAIAIIAVVLPHAGGLGLLGTVPMGLLAYRYRIRVLITATVAAGVIGFLVVGLSGFTTVLLCAYVGGLAGIVKRRGRGTPTVIALSFVAGVVVGAVVVIALTVLARLRQLVFGAITATVHGVAAIMARVPHLQAPAQELKRLFAEALNYWPWLVLGYAAVAMTVASVIGWWALSRVLQRLRGVPDVHKLDAPVSSGPIQPVPVRLDEVRVRYPHADHDALGAISLDVRAGEHVAVTGANGSGKSTLMLILAGREPTSGTVARPGAVGLGQLGGTAVVMQHPETQVLGTRVADDVVWGLPPGKTTDVGRLLSEVGLAELAERDTGGLSGGELQRLAVAAALAREPALLIADEVTSMVDQQGRDALLRVLSGLTDHHRTALVYITHYNNEADSADRTINLSESLDNTTMVETAAAPAPTVAVGYPHAPVLEIAGVGHEYGSGTPWAKTALRDVSFVVHEGDGLLIHGGNGSGKSTLAWIMAGLTKPTTGICRLDQRLSSDQVGAVALKFQAARLQLMRSRVDLEVASAGGFSPDDHTRVTAALAVVGLDAALAKRRIDQLSGGQMRHVVLAGLLARSPRVLILDEPLAGLDAASQRGLVRLLADRRRDTGLTVVVISHDFAGLEELCPRILHLRDGLLEPASAAAPVDSAPATSPAKHPTRRPPRPVVLLRPVPGRSAIHELWAGTKLIVVFGISLLLTFYPGWVAIGLLAALVLATVRVAHIPRGVLPSVPRWLWILLAIVGVTAVLAGGDPLIQVGRVSLGLGGLLDFLRLTALSIVLLGLGAMVSWTTNVAEIAPAVATLGRPLRRLRIPVDDWSVALALALRTFPMLIDEFGVLRAARRLRPKQIAPTRSFRLRRWAAEVIDLIVAVVTVTLRRADEMGDAITARGGTGQISAAESRPKLADWVALSIVSAVCATALAAELVLGG